MKLGEELNLLVQSSRRERLADRLKSEAATGKSELKMDYDELRQYWPEWTALALESWCHLNNLQVTLCFGVVIFRW